MARLTTGFAVAIFVFSFMNGPMIEATTPTTKGNDALIPCKSTKSGSNLSYEWSRGTSSSPLSDHPELKDRVSVTADGALLINRFDKKDHGKYVCVIKSGNSMLEEVPVDVDDTYLLQAENCHPGSCIEASKCSGTRGKLSCPDAGEVCCSFIKNEDKHRCRHFLGECIRDCRAVNLRRNADDCPAGTTCCILV